MCLQGTPLSVDELELVGRLRTAAPQPSQPAHAPNAAGLHLSQLHSARVLTVDKGASASGS